MTTGRNLKASLLISRAWRELQLFVNPSTVKTRPKNFQHSATTRKTPSRRVWKIEQRKGFENKSQLGYLRAEKARRRVRGKKVWWEISPLTLFCSGRLCCSALAALAFQILPIYVWELFLIKTHKQPLLWRPSEPRDLVRIKNACLTREICPEQNPSRLWLARRATDANLFTDTSPKGKLIRNLCFGRSEKEFETQVAAKSRHLHKIMQMPGEEGALRSRDFVCTLRGEINL